jgi:hypothetical protein
MSKVLVNAELLLSGVTPAFGFQALATGYQSFAARFFECLTRALSARFLGARPGLSFSSWLLGSLSSGWLLGRLSRGWLLGSLSRGWLLCGSTRCCTLLQQFQYLFLARIDGLEQFTIAALVGVVL